VPSDAPLDYEHTFELAHQERNMAHHHERPVGMHTDRTRDDDGRLRQKRGDTHIGNIEREYGVDFGVRDDMHLQTLRAKTGLTSIEDLVQQARSQR
jgi:hypothetical protein